MNYMLFAIAAFGVLLFCLNRLARHLYYENRRLVFWSVQGVTVIVTWRVYNQAALYNWQSIHEPGGVHATYLTILDGRRTIWPADDQPRLVLRTEDFRSMQRYILFGAFLEQAEFDITSRWQPATTREEILKDVDYFRRAVGLPPMDWSVLPPESENVVENK